MNFLTELATNATKHDVGFVLYSGNDDTLIAHRGTEGSIAGFIVLSDADLLSLQ